MTTTTTEISNSEDMLDVRDIIARVELASADEPTLEDVELLTLQALLDDLKGNGGDEQWKGDWYPILLIRDTYFRDYAEQMAEDIGAIDPKAGWPNMFIDWERATEALQQDYQTVSFDGVDYWYR